MPSDIAYKTALLAPTPIKGWNVINAPVVAVPYRALLLGERKMPVSWDLFKWVVGGLLVIIAALIGFLWNSVSSNVRELHSDVREMNSQVSSIRADVAGISGKLDLVVQELKHR